MIEEIKGLKPDFKLSNEGTQKLNEKYRVWENEQQEGDNDDYDDCQERESYGQYGGSYAQDVEGLNDDFKNDV